MPDPVHKKRANAEDVAQMAHVSRSAVSRTFTPGASVAPDTRARVITAAAALGYRPTSRKHTGVKSSRPVAVIMANLLSPYFAELSDRLNRDLAGRGLRTLFFVASDPAHVDDVVEHALSCNVQGMIIFSAIPTPSALAAARTAHVPIVILNRNERVDGASLVWIDGPEIGRSVARLMLTEGRCHPLAIATGPTRSRELTAFAETMEANGSAPCRWIDTGWNYDDGLRMAGQLDRALAMPDAIFAASDALAIGMLDGLRRIYGLDAPRDMSIIGFGDTAPSNWASHRISTVRLPILSLIQTAVSTLLNRMYSLDEPAPRIWLSCDIIERDSTLHMGL